MKKKRRKSRNLVIAIVIMTITIGFAALSTNIKISGLYNINSMSWNVYWSNPQVTGGNVEATSIPTVSNSTSVSYAIPFASLGDYYEFTVDAVNNGSLDAIIDSIDNKIYAADGVTEIDFPAYLRYSIKNSDNTDVKRGQTLSARQTKTYKIRIEFSDDVNPSDLPSTSDVVLNFNLVSNYVQKNNEIANSYAYYDGYAADGDYSTEYFISTDVDEDNMAIAGFNGEYKPKNPVKGLYSTFSLSLCPYEEAFSGTSFSDCNVENKVFPELRKLVIPYKINNKTVTSVDLSNGGDYGVNNAIEEIIVPKSVTSLTLSKGYERLKLLTLPSSLNTLPWVEIGADSNKVLDVRIGDGTTTIGSVSDPYGESSYPNFNAQGTENMINLYIPSSVTSIADDAIYYHDIKNIYVSDSTTKAKVVSSITNYCSDGSYYTGDSDACIQTYTSKIRVIPNS